MEFRVDIRWGHPAEAWEAMLLKWSTGLAAQDPRDMVQVATFDARLGCWGYLCRIAISRLCAVGKWRWRHKHQNIQVREDTRRFDKEKRDKSNFNEFRLCSSSRKAWLALLHGMKCASDYEPHWLTSVRALVMPWHCLCNSTKYIELYELEMYSKYSVSVPQVYYQ